ncbi:aminoglycoside phosphotransferase [Dictyobacter alpinus]|uniref:Aminoglycoside phosphotransferase n=1 Tax=Dictyobacter alpinus TaxID=2014873 RepID=A0A402BA63_9CHLR|nr:phosphotransferase [Dictyobacter alpinus]GCE28274.1 aminoglycoside phosphotransferase [Dictyobacter alpinus]
MTPDELTTLLYQAGVLQDGRAVEVQVTENEAFNSHVQHLVVTYSMDTMPQLPSALVVKRNVQADWGREDGRREVEFYRLIDRQAERLPMLIPHFVAEYDQATENSVLLLQDLSATHQPPITRQQQIYGSYMPDEALLGQIVETLAAFHATWWDDPQLGTYPLVLDTIFQDEGHFRAYCQECQQNWQSLLTAEENWLPLDVVHDINEIQRLLPALWERSLSHRFPGRQHLTVTHNDAYLANFLVPRTGQAGSIYLLDWQSPYAGIGAYDLVIMCASFWTSAQRHENDREINLLRRYFTTLQASGIIDYSWDQLLEDYRLMILVFLQVAIWDQTNGSSRSYWWPKLQCLLNAARDLDSLSLLR